MERGTINDIPVYVRVFELSGGERTVIKEAPNVDGASAEPLGQQPQRYRVDFTLIQDGEWIVPDYETASLDLRAMFLAGGPFTLRAPVVGEVTGLWIDGTYSITLYDESRQLMSEGSVTLIDAEPLLILSESSRLAVQSAIAVLSKSVALDLDRRQTPPGPYDGALDMLAAGVGWMTKTQGKIASAFQPVNDVAGQIKALENQIEQLLLTPQLLASQVMSTALQLLSLVPSLAAQGDTDLGSAAVQNPTTDKAADVFIEALSDGVAFDAGLPTLQAYKVDPPSVEDLEEVDEAAAAKQLILASVALSVSLAVTSADFATINSVLAVADALEPAYEALFNLAGIDYGVYQHARSMRRATRSHLSEVAAGLPRLLSYTIQEITDVFSLVPRLYPDLGSDGDDVLQNAVDSLIDINGLGPEMIRLLPGTQINYLDPIV